MDNPIVFFDRYKYIAEIGESRFSRVIKVQDMENNLFACIKILKESVTSSFMEDIVRFKREIDTVCRLNHIHLVKIISTGEYNGFPCIIMEYIEGIRLSEYMKKSSSIQDKVRILKQLTSVLDYVHKYGVIHRDIKPSNVMIYKDGNPILIDFGISLIVELSKISEEKDIVGTFGYMSPESTGILNKSIDERSDLYSLGVVFYEMITGDLPFKGDSVGKILHQQVTLIPQKPSNINPQISPELDEIIMKLMHKDPDLRYQSSRGLLYDIERYERGEKDFAIGEQDQKIKLTYRTRIVGREEESAIIKKHYEDAEKGMGNVILIGGEAGLGKSRLVEEIVSYVYSNNGLFLWGRCINKDNKTPYQAFSDIIDQYIQLLEKNEETNPNEINRIKNIIGDFGEIITRINPRITRLIGIPEKIVELDLDKENKRFLMVTSDFFCKLAEKTICVLYFDDLQWADEGTLILLMEIVDKISTTKLLIIGTYRSNEIYEGHKMDVLKKLATEKSSSIHDILLSPLSLEKIAKMTSYLLGEKEEKLKSLSLFILEKSSGNPFFAINIIRELVEEKAIEWKDGRWNYYWEKINTLTVSDSIIDIILKRIDNLTEIQTQILCTAAIIGREFETNLLYKLLDLGKEKVIHTVDEVIELNLLEQSKHRGRILFVHDRIREAFYAKMNKEERKTIHQTIADVLEEENKENVRNIIFDLVYHFEEADDREKLLKYVFIAAKNAQKAFANEDAIRDYNQGIALYMEKGLQDHPDVICAKEQLTDIYVTIGKNEETIALCNELLKYKSTALQKAVIYRKIGLAYFNQSDWKNCEENFIKALALVGENFPRKLVPLHILMEIFTHFLHTKFPWIFAHKEGQVVREEDIEKINIFYAMGWSLVLTDLKKFLYGTIRPINISDANIGKSSELAASFQGIGCFMMMIPLFKGAITYFQNALSILDEINDPPKKARGFQFMAICYTFMASYKNAEDALLEAKKIYKDIGDLWEVGNTNKLLAEIYRYTGRYIPAISGLLEYLKASQKIKDNNGIANALTKMGHVLIEKGDYLKAEKCLKDSLTFSENLNYVRCYTLANLGLLHIEKKNFLEAIEYLKKAKELYENNRLVKDYTVYLFPLLADAYLEHLKVASSLSNMFERKQKLAEIGKLIKLSNRESKRWPNHHGITLRITGKYFAALGNIKKALKHFTQSIQYLDRIGRKYELAKSYFEYGCYLNKIDMFEDAKENYLKAMEIFKLLESGNYISRIKSHLQEEDLQSVENNVGRLKENRKMETMLTISRHISSILDIDILLEKVFSEAVELTGAERGMLLLYQHENDTKHLKIISSKNISLAEYESRDFYISQKIIQKVEDEKNPVLIINAEDDEFIKSNSISFRGEIKSIICVPISSRSEFLGILYLDNRLLGGIFTKGELDIINLLAGQAAISIQNADLYRKAVTDSLTGLCNRGYFDNFLLQKIYEVRRYSKGLSLLMMDIDFFKKFNDTYGHVVGDKVLRSVAKAIQRLVRKSDLIARYGGEEIVAVLPETDLMGACIAAEKMRKCVEELEVMHVEGLETKILKVTISIGVAQLKEGEEKISLVERADLALYNAKAKGRNRVEYNDSII